MKFVIGFAGIPHEVYEQVYKNRDVIATPGAEFVSTPLKPYMFAYGAEHAEFFGKEFEQRIRADHHNELADTAFALVCINHDEQSTAAFRKHFFPSTLVVSVDWAIEWGSPTTIRQSGNRLVECLRSASKSVRTTLGPLKKELSERSNKTPFLLPLRNFRSQSFVTTLQQLQENLVASQDKTDTIRMFAKAVERDHPLKQDEQKLWFFVDDRNVRFRAPGRARHAFARPDDGGVHPHACLLSGRRRLGAPYDRAFHYDCTRGQENLKAAFHTCHGRDESDVEGDPHLNIAPNDFVRR
ncbi:hypothetical protein PQR70_26075 [Paraburkholderia madseniana]|uniref:hypothetical protein n=1 Tax=Paraburkholderia madseniana TaxID=2599607 RepID=UPI0038B750EB